MAKKGHHVFINYDLKRENGLFERFSKWSDGVLKTVSKLYKELTKGKCLVIYLEIRDDDDFKEDEDGFYRVKKSKRP